jgi:hypothetical protein
VWSPLVAFPDRDSLGVSAEGAVTTIDAQKNLDHCLRGLSQAQPELLRQDLA